MSYTKQLLLTWNNFNDSDNLFDLLTADQQNLFTSKIVEMSYLGKTERYSTLLPTETPGQVRSRKFLDDATVTEWLDWLYANGFTGCTTQVFDI